MRHAFSVATRMLDRILKMSLQIAGGEEALPVKDLVDNLKSFAGELQRFMMRE